MSCDTVRHSWLCFFFNDTATPEIYTLSLHDALPICHSHRHARGGARCRRPMGYAFSSGQRDRSEEHTSELQSPYELGCRLLLVNKPPFSVPAIVTSRATCRCGNMWPYGRY